MMKMPSFLLPHQAEVELYLGDGAYGPKYGDAVTYKCRIEANRKLVRDTEGREVVSETFGMFEYKNEDIPPESRIRQLDDNGKVIREFKVISSQPMTGLRSVSHIEVRM